MVEVRLKKIIIDEKNPEQFVVLQEKEGQRSLPIVIGITEASAIRMKLNKIASPRPLTHDLICQIIERLGLKLAKVVVDDLKEGVFYAKLHLAGLGKTTIVDARPSDSIAVAIRSNSPIFIEERVFQAFRK